MWVWWTQAWGLPEILQSSRLKVSSKWKTAQTSPLFFSRSTNKQSPRFGRVVSVKETLALFSPLSLLSAWSTRRALRMCSCTGLHMCSRLCCCSRQTLSNFPGSYIVILHGTIHMYPVPCPEYPGTHGAPMPKEVTKNNSAHSPSTTTVNLPPLPEWTETALLFHSRES